MEEPRKSVERLSANLAILLKEAQGALRGERDFCVENVSKLRSVIEEMDAVLREYGDLRSSQSDGAVQLQHYKSQLNELQTTIRRLRIVLLARKSDLQATKSHHTAVSRWIGALNQTR